MVELLFADFLKDPHSYDQAVRHWLDLWMKTDEAARKSKGWQHPWMISRFANGVELRDGNPVFSAWSPQLRKGLRIIQHEPTRPECELSFWIDDCGEGEDFVQELVVACALSDEASILAFSLINSWVLGDIDVNDSGGPMEGLVAGRKRE
jgi:hypothetical protein